MYCMRAAPGDVEIVWKLLTGGLEPVYHSSGERLIGGQCCSHLGLSWGRCIANRGRDHEARMSTKVYRLVTSALLRLDEGLDGVLQ